MTVNEGRIFQSAATICALLGADAPAGAAEPLEAVLSQAKAVFGQPRAGRVFFYNPDAIGRWITAKYADDFSAARAASGVVQPLTSVFPPVTPVCFASMYSGLTPDGHGIHSYVKPVLSVETVFDVLPAAGRRCAIVSTANDSISMIFLNRPVDYFIYPTVEECNDKALELIDADKYDFIVLYNGNYDHWMHRFGPEGRRPLRALRENLAMLETLRCRIADRWSGHDTVLAFAPDHGCHRKFGILGSHGIDKPCDMEIEHYYAFLPAK